MRNAFKLSIVEPLWKRLLGRHRRGWEDDINIDFKNIWREYFTQFIWLSGGLLGTIMNFNVT
jgi:hypothetical protein